MSDKVICYECNGEMIRVNGVNHYHCNTCGLCLWNGMKFIHKKVNESDTVWVKGN
jgi:hypothetical protein